MSSPDILGLLAQAQPSQTPISPSPEVLKALADLAKAAGGRPPATEWLTPDGLKSITGFITALAWPILVLVVLLAFRPQVRGRVEGLTEFDLFGLIKGKVRNELNQSAHAAEQSEGLSQAPTPGELERAVEVEKLTRQTDLSFVRQQVDELAAEYERVRGSMRAGDTRTRAMEIVVSKMRTIGRAAYPLRHELSISPSPGRRLQAIASLQVIPDYDDLLDWLADRLDTERPFVSYHALVALTAAATDERAPAHLPALERALAKVRVKSVAIGRDTDRQQVLRQFESQVERLRVASTPN